MCGLSHYPHPPRTSQGTPQGFYGCLGIDDTFDIDEAQRTKDDARSGYLAARVWVTPIKLPLAGYCLVNS